MVLSDTRHTYDHTQSGEKKNSRAVDGFDAGVMLLAGLGTTPPPPPPPPPDSCQLKTSKFRGTAYLQHTAHLYNLAKNGHVHLYFKRIQDPSDDSAK